MTGAEEAFGRRGDGPAMEEGTGAVAGVEVLGLDGVAAIGVGRQMAVPELLPESMHVSMCSLIRKAGTEAPQIGHVQKRLSDAPVAGCLRDASGGGVTERLGMRPKPHHSTQRC